ncbi:hypothetical protein FWG76_01960, partial [Candidatus Saccharibacteria bacterium]|nr:hypothetical protein [Candidatus Saccharibacteria bacterium]
MKLRLLYLHTFLHYAGDTVGEVFSAVLLYSLGFSIVHILVFCGLKWGVMALLTPLMPVIVSKMGFLRAGVISVLAIIAANLILITRPEGEVSFVIFGVLLVLYGIGGSVTLPIQTTMRVMFIPEPERGRVNGRLFAMRAAAVMTASLLIGFFLEHRLVMVLTIAGTLALSLVPLGLIFMGVKRPKGYSYGTTFGIMRRKAFRRFMPVFALRAPMHTERFLISLFIFLVVGNITLLAIYVVFATLVEMIVMLLLGNRFDQNRSKAFRLSAVSRSLSLMLLSVRPFVERLPVVGQIFNRIASRAYD